MTDVLKPYPEYKPSGLQWTEHLPAHWSVERAKSLFVKMKRPALPEEPIVTCFRDGVVTLRKNRRIRGFTESLLEIGYQGIRKGELVIHAMDAFAGAVGVSDSDGKGSPVYVVCHPKSEVNAHYYAFIVREMARAQWILALARGIRERSTDFRFDTFGAQRVPFPPVEEQVAIVRFLQWSNGRLDRAVRVKQREVSLLNERKQTLIHDAITRGFDQSVALKPSGIAWLGDVPVHWQVKRLKWATRLQRGYDLPQDRRLAGTVPVVSSGGIIDNHSEAKALAPGVVMGRYGSTESVFYIDRPFWPHNTSLFVRNFYGNSPRWCYFLLRTISKADYAGKSAVPGIDRKDLFDIYVPVPPIKEQESLVHSLDSQVQTVDRVIEAKNREILLIREYQARLVSDVVTGKLDVREVSLPIAESIPSPAYDTEVETVEDEVIEEELANVDN